MTANTNLKKNIMFKLTNCKEVALKGFIVEWLKDKQVYCNMCGEIYLEGESCCNKPQIGTNSEFIAALVRQNAEIKQNMAKETAASADNTFRWGISITPRLLHDMEQYSMNTLKEPLWKDPREMQDFMGSFPEFRVCKTI